MNLHPRDALTNRWICGLLCMLTVLPACAPPSSPAARAPTESGPSGSRASPSKVTIAILRDVTTLHDVKWDSAGSVTAEFSFLVNSPLVILGPQGEPRPLVAAEIPSRDRGTWTVNPDGTMATTWTIRPNAVWHDDKPLTSRDFDFALQVYMDPEFPIGERQAERLMDRIETRDDKTFVIHWKQMFLGADRLINKHLPPLPEHLLGELSGSGDRQAFQNSPFWTTTAYVGNGPFRLADWEKGTQHVYHAFDRYFMGRPKLDEVIIRVIPDVNTVVANLLSGEVDFTSGQAINTQAGLVVKEQWDRTGGGRILLTQAVRRHIWFQHEPSRVGLASLLDLRVRRALVHAIDRVSLAELVSAGNSPVAETMIVPRDPLFSRVDQVITKYPFDRARALALLQEAGWTRRGDSLVNAAGQSFALPYEASMVSDNLTEMEVVANDLATIGIQVSQHPFRQGSRTREEEASFTGLSFIPVRNMEIPDGMVEFTSGQCPTSERRFVGTNRGCWSNSEYDRLFAAAMVTLDQRARDDLVVEAMRILSEQLPVIPLSYNMEYNAVRKGLSGPVERWLSQRGYTWNIHEWQWEQRGS